MGFVLVVVLARQLGAEGSGVVMQAVASFMIGLSLARLGMDTTAVWIIPRLRTEAPEEVRGACFGLLASAAVAGAAGAAVWMVATLLIPDTKVAEAITSIAWALPLGSVMLVALAATRGLGGVLPFNLIGNIGVPTARPLAVLVVTALGGSVIAAALAWAAPLVVGVLAALLVLSRQVRRFERRELAHGRMLPTAALQRRILGFALPRTLASALEQSIIWFDVVLVGIIAGPAAAGVYAAASRFVSAGVIVLTALRIVVAPRFSAALAAGKHALVQELYVVTAGWILLFGAPIYVLLAVFSPTVLELMGPDFDDGVLPMRVLCLGAVMLLAGGNIQSLLLMSGHSGWGAINKATVFTVNVVLNLVLVPPLGILGAAISWAACMSLDTTLAMVQVFRFTGIRPAVGRIGAIVLAVVGCVGVPSVVVAWLWGNHLGALLVAAALSGVCLLLYCRWDAERLRISELRALLPGGRSRVTRSG